MASIKTWRSPVLLIQGDDDRNVPFAETVQLAEALRRQHVEFEELVFPDEIHDFLLRRDWAHAYAAGADFLDRKLGWRDGGNRNRPVRCGKRLCCGPDQAHTSSKQ